MGVGSGRISALKEEFEKVSVVLERCESVDKGAMVSKREFERRQKATFEALDKAGLQVGFVFSDEHYCGDVPYLGGNTNVSIEQVAGVIGESGFHIIAGLEGGYVAEQLAGRSGSKVHKVQMLQLADEKYPIEAERLEDVMREANGGREVKSLGLLTPRQVVPSAIVEYLNKMVGPKNVVDAQELYYKVKYLKSDEEMRLIEDASKIANAMMRAMLAVLKPGLLETQVAAWGYFVAKELGSEENGWDVMVGANEANRTLIGKALNRAIRKGDYVHLGVAPKRDGLNSCVRRSVVAVEDPREVTADQRYWFDFIEGAFEVGYGEYCRVAREGLPARLQEEALVKYFRGKTREVNARFNLNLEDLSKLKPYTGTHNAGYTECQEFYGAITLDSEEPLGEQIVTMLDVALRGIGDMWDDVVIPGLDYVVIEDTLGKFGKAVRDFNEKVPRNAQGMVGNVSELL
ncbi:MAG: M24 family metallopeptidase [Candidatus Brockarchaeota archaeon]|nr:M24 family metallopeptidase [Candidatus Brockarchaeota archaeon]